MNLKHVALKLCTCTWIEIMTGVGITLYLLHLQNYYLAALTVAVFVPLIGFHFAIDRLSSDKADWEQGRLIRIRLSKYKLVD
ncbi:MAG TPA: hypothetical protein VJZ68_10415 [Nitrososphaera sp.]|nr:hypothetical protein [Nitrososphaera sp.]